MVRTLSALLFTILMAAPSWADAASDLKAGTDAAQAGRHDEAIAALTRALDDGALPADGQLKALRTRGGEYVTKSLMAEAFDRRDDARRQRDNAIADFSRALALKADDAELLSERGNVFYLNGQYDPSLADLDALLRLKPSAITQMQRAGVYRAKGAYDRAIADYDQLLTSNLADPGLEPWDIHIERGYTDFLAGRFDAAASDFEKGLALGLAAHTGDVLWTPYQAAWLHVARARAGQDDKKELAELAGKINLDQWPGALIAYFLGRRGLADIGSQSGHGSVGRSRDCNMSFFVGQDLLAKGDRAAAERSLRHAQEVCNIHAVTALAAEVELARLKK